MDNVEWIDFIQEIVKKGNNVNLKKECEKRGVGLNTLYRKVSGLEQTNYQLYQQFVILHPYKPRDTQGIDFEQLMRESIITGISQKELEAKYGVSKRTIQRKFANIEAENYNLYYIYQLYVDALKTGKTLHHSVIDKIVEEYVPQVVSTEKEKLESRRNQFKESIRNAKENKQRQLCKHYEEQIMRIDKQIESKERGID